jgi:DNA integrity scanning protein DisA with diadenylate cyclase activity
MVKWRVGIFKGLTVSLPFYVILPRKTPKSSIYLHLSNLQNLTKEKSTEKKIKMVRTLFPEVCKRKEQRKRQKKESLLLSKEDTL